MVKNCPKIRFLARKMTKTQVFNQKPGQIYPKISFLVEGCRFWEFFKFFETFWSCLGILGRFLEKLKTHSQKIVKNDQKRPKIHKKQKTVPKSDQK